MPPGTHFKSAVTTCRRHLWQSLGANCPSQLAGFRNLRLPSVQATWFRTVLDQSLELGSALGSAPEACFAGKIAEGLIACAAQALCAATADADGRTERALNRRLSLLHAARIFVQEKLQNTFTMRDLVAATATSERSLEYLFNDAYGVSPRDWFLLTRLHRIRQELIAADPSSTSVQAIASRWGISHGGRFAGIYRELFGELPRETLARRRPTAAKLQAMRIRPRATSASGAGWLGNQA